jgi:iron complex outermembrane receptor protein
MLLRAPAFLTTAVALLSLAVPGHADPATGRVSGVVRDSTGGVVQRASVQIESPAAGIKRTVLSDERGQYAFDALPPGRYKVSVNASGFDTAVHRDVAVEETQEAAVDLVLTVARQKALVVVTAPAMSDPLVVETDPRQARQPIPAHDGADYLKTIPGFSVIRKGGTDGDPVLRGMSGSRLAVLMDDQPIFGGCGGRMDPPTAYVFPAAYDRITVIKGPETVLRGPGASAGTVVFEHEIERVDQPGASFDGSLTGGRFGRQDQMADARATAPWGYVRAIGTRSHTGDFRDANGVSVHSFYTRWSGNAALGWTPDKDTLLELSAAQSNGQAAYADRGMDGPRFARDNVAIQFDRTRPSSWLRKLEAHAFYNHIDHVMDNFSLRTPGATFSAMNPDRTTTGGRAAVTLAPGSRTTVVIGGDTRRDVHTGRSAMATSAQVAIDTYLAKPRVEDMRFRQLGVFGEATHHLGQSSRIIAGYRADWHRAKDSRACVAASMCSASSLAKNDTQGATDRKTLHSGFGRYELDVRHGSGTLYAGLGHVERFPDYWERLKQDPVTLKSAFLTTRPEKTTQLDLGMLWKSGRWDASVSGFYGRVSDYVLIRWSPVPALTRNVDVTTIGSEADLAYRIASSWRVQATVAYVRGENDTDHKPLAQQPPLEGTLDVNYASRRLTLGALARLVATQDRVDIGSGSIVANGMDLGRTGGFSVFSIHGGYRLSKSVLLTAGIDNLLDRVYAEHLSRGGALVPGFIQTARINEPSRTFWIKTDFGIR